MPARPLDAAHLYRSLGAAWAARPQGERTQNLKRADAAWHTALERLSHDGSGAERAALWNDRGLAQIQQARSGSGDAAEAAVAAFRHGAEALADGADRVLAAQLAKNLGSASLTAASLGRPVSLSEAADALDRATATWHALVRTAEAGGTLLNAGMVYVSLHPAHGRRSDLDRAIERLSASVDARTSDADPAAHAMAQFNLGLALALRAAHTDPADLEAGAPAFRAALELWPASGAPGQQAVAHTNLAGVLIDLRGGDASGRLREAVGHCDQALMVYDRATHPRQHAVIMTNLALARRRLESPTDADTDG